MSTESLVKLTYVGGWVCAGVAVVYKFLCIADIANALAAQTQVLPHHLWQLSFLLFLISIASTTIGRAKTA